MDKPIYQDECIGTEEMSIIKQVRPQLSKDIENKNKIKADGIAEATGRVDPNHE